MTSFHHTVKSGKKGSALAHAQYITRQGKHRSREDLVYAAFGNLPTWAAEQPLKFWKASDEHERANGTAFLEHIVALPNELTFEQNLELANNLAHAFAHARPYQLAIHAPTASLGGELNTHLHVMYSNREDDGIERSAEQLFRRHNPTNPEVGGRKKTGSGKNRHGLREALIATRKTCADLQNAALAKHGHTERVDHRTLREQGVQRKPEHHLGQARIRKMSHDDRAQYVSQRHA